MKSQLQQFKSKFDSNSFLLNQIYSSKHIFGLCIILSCISIKSTQTFFDTYFPCISNCWARPRDLQKIVYFNWGSTCRQVWEPL